MKKYLLLLTILLWHSGKAQYVTIPDTNFVKFLQANFPYCTGQNQLDTTCPDVINKTRMWLPASYGIVNFEGIEYFPNLQYLFIQGDGTGDISTIPAWPPSVTHLELDYFLRGSSVADLPATLDSLDMDDPWETPTLPEGLSYLYYIDDDYDSLPILPPALTTLSWGPWDSVVFRQTFPSRLTNLSLFTAVGVPADSFLALPNSLRELFCFRAIKNLPAHLPDSLRVLSISQCGINYMPPLPNSLDTFICSNNKLTALPSFPATLQYIDCSENQLTDSLPNLPGALTQLYCSGNLLTSLGTLPGALQYFYCDHNQLATLPVLPSSLQGIKCQNNLLTSLPDLPSYLWYFDCDSNLNLYCFPKLGYIEDLSFYQTPISCLPDYGYVQSSYPDFNSIPLCGFLNSRNCTSYWNVNGKNFFDHNSNCTIDTGERPFYSAPVKVLSGNGVLQQEIIPGNDGLFSFQLPNGNYELQIDTSNDFPFEVNCPDTNSYSLNINNVSFDTAQNFGITCKPGFDLAVYYISNWVVFKPANLTRVSLFAGDFANYYNVQCAFGIGGTVTVTFDGPVKYFSLAPDALPPSSVTSNSIVWNVSDFANVNAGSSFNFILQTDTSAMENDEVCITATVTTSAVGDNNPSNNTLTQCYKVITSHDPNQKTVYPSGNIDTSSQWLTYTVFFQNTGNDTARNIRVIDTLSNNLDISSFQYLSSSVKVNPIIQVIGNTVTFNFLNINLPDINTSEPQSQAYIQYRVKTLPNLSFGTQIQNTAYIYFDFNAPVATNTTNNTVSLTTGITPITISKEPGLKIFPNPVIKQVYISVSGFTPTWTTVYDISGQVITTMKYSPQIDVSNLANSIYFVEVKNEQTVERGRFIKAGN